MKKVLFLLLLLVILGVANMSAQVRIGGDGEPNAAAVLDLNEDDDTNDGTKGLALPRVSLDSNTAILAGATSNLNGMLVYNTNTSTSNGLSGTGIYYWDGTRWLLLQTMGLWSAEQTCSGCGSLPVGSAGLVTPFSAFGAPPWASYNTCWASLTGYGNYYTLAINSVGVYVNKIYATSSNASMRLFCWGPLI